MSRRLRIEEEKLKQLKDELQEEEDKLKLQLERIFGPLVWRRLQNGIKIQDLQEKHFQAAVELILENYMQEDILFRNTTIKDDLASQKSFADRLIFKLKDRASIMAIDEDVSGFENKSVERNPKFRGSICIPRICPSRIIAQISFNANEDCLVGVLVLNPVTKCDFGRVYSRTMLVEGKAYKSITDFMNYINRKVDVFDQCQCDIYLRYYLLCIRSDYRNKGLGYQMMQVGIDIARHLKIPIVMGVFNNYNLQKIAKKIGFNQILFEYKYVKWSDKNGELVFCDPGPGNYTCNVMAGIVPPPPEPDPVPSAEEKASKAKVTRSDKKKQKLKI